MAELIPAQCGFCHKQFKLRPDQLGRQVHCPHCKTVVKISAISDVGREAIEALSSPETSKQAAQAKRRPTQFRGGVRSPTVAYTWAIIIGVGAVAVVSLLAYKIMNGGFGNVVEPPPSQPVATGPQVPVRVQMAGAPAKVDTPPAEGTVAPGDEPVEVDHKILWGFRNGTRAYLTGKVTNMTPKTIRAMTISIPVVDKTKVAMGDAKAIIRDLPSGKAAPLVAILDYQADLEPGGHGDPVYQMDPPGVAKPPAVIELEGVAWPKADPEGEAMASGVVDQKIWNRGTSAIEAVEISAVMRDENGKAIGAARSVVKLDQKLAKDAGANVKLPYEHCVESKIRATDVWVQVADPADVPTAKP